jgi:hypothetical protein
MDTQRWIPACICRAVRVVQNGTTISVRSSLFLFLVARVSIDQGLFVHVKSEVVFSPLDWLTERRRCEKTSDLTWMYSIFMCILYKGRR